MIFFNGDIYHVVFSVILGMYGVLYGSLTRASVCLVSTLPNGLIQKKNHMMACPTQWVKFTPRVIPSGFFSKPMVWASEAKVQFHSFFPKSMDFFRFQ